MSLAKSAPTGMGLLGFPGGTVTLMFTLTAVCPSCPTTPCAAPATPTTATATVAFYPGAAGPCPPVPPAGPPAFSFTTPVALPACTPAGAFTTYTIVAPVPAATPLGVYCAYGTVNVTFSDGMTLAASGDTKVCIVAPVPGQPGVPRLSLTLLSESAPRLAPGDVAVARYAVRNNDPSNSVQLNAIAGSRQSAVRPQGGNERQGVFAISAPFGDDFPIVFNPGSNCIPLPSHPYTQTPITAPLPVLPPGQSNVITVGIRSYGQCANGSCSESTLAVTGTFSDNTPALACAGMALIVDTSVASTPCARSVNDCNQNGIPDAIDIANGTSQDRNYNALPDECEQFINVPTSVNATPQTTPPGGPLTVQVAFNEVVPMVNVWANGNPLVRTQQFGVPFWMGTIPADTRPGPQTVYFLGKDQIGGLSTMIAPYQVGQPPITVPVPSGYSTIADNLLATPNNNLTTVMPNPAEDTQIFKWNRTTRSYDAFFFEFGTWIDGATGNPSDTTLLPGEGAWIFSPFPQTFVFRGTVGPTGPQPRPAPGLCFVSCRAPQPCTFEEMMGFPPIVGDKVLKYDNSGPTLPDPSSTHTFTATGWSPSVPVLAVGKAAFVDLVAPGTPPTITQQPQNQVVSQGQTATFTVAATGTGPLSYQWRLNGSVTPGATSSTLTIANAQASNAGNYDVLVSNSFGTSTSASASLTVVPPPPVITGVIPSSGTVGDVITITGSGFRSNANDLCSMVMGSVPVTMRVLSATDTRITARLGAVAPNAQPGPIGVTLGTGNTASFQPAFLNIVVQENWTFRGPPTGALSSVTFTPIYTPPDTGQQWFFSTLSNGVLCVYLQGNWGTDARVWIDAHLKTAGAWYDMQPRTVFAGSGTTLDCAKLIKDVIVCDLQQNQGVLLPAEVSDLGGGIAKITVHAPNNQPISMGWISICTTPPRVPVITGIAPLTGRSGDVIAITGSGFGNNPDNLCAAVMGNPPVAMRVLSATDTRITARVGAVSPNATPGRIGVMVGQGNTALFTPALPGITVQNNWTWQSREIDGLSPVDFTPIFVPPDLGGRWFFGVYNPGNGQLSIDLSGNWGANARIWVELHLLSRGSWYDLQTCDLFAGSGTTLDCATKLKDLIVCSLEQDQGAVVPATITDLGGGVVRVTLLGVNDQFITAGSLSVCTSPPRIPVIASVSPPSAASGDIITITGSGFGNNPDNICLMAVGNLPGFPPWDPLRVLSATDTRITARLGTVPPPMGNMPPPVLMMQLGDGNVGPFVPIFPQILGGDDTWVWTSREPAALAPGAFQTIYTPPDAGQQYFFGQISNGVICVYIRGNWVTNSRVTVEMHFNAGGTHYDMQERTVTFANGGTAFDCARFIKDLIVCSFSQRGGVLLPADVEQIAPDLVKVTVRSPNSQPITSGLLTICCMAPRVPVITGVNPTTGVTGDIITINGSGFGNNPNNVCVMAVGNTAGFPPWDPLRVLSATDTRITARLGTVPPPMGNMPPPVLMVQLGEGNSGPIVPIFPGILGGDDTWVWTSRETAAVAPGTFQTIHTPPGPGQQYFYGQVTNGVMCVYIRGDWVTNSRVTVETHFNAGSTHYDMQERTVTFANGGTAFDCARFIKDLIVCAFSQRAGVLLPADVTQVAADLVKVTIRSPNNQPITSGMLIICCLAPQPVKEFTVPTTGQTVTNTLTETEENAGSFLRAIIPNARWEREFDWALIEPRYAGGPITYSDLLYLRNEGGNAVIVFVSDADAGPPLQPPRPNPLLVPSTGTPLLFLADLVVGGTAASNRTVKIIAHSDGEQPILGIYSDVLTVQVSPRIPPNPKVATVPVNGVPVTNTLTEAEENAGAYIKCVIPNAQWERERDWALTEPSFTGAALPLSDLLLLRNEGPNAVVILISDADAGPALIPPNPFPIPVPSTGNPLPFLANLTIAGGTDRTVKITVHSDGETPIQGVFSDVLIVQVCPPIPLNPKIATVPVTGEPVTATLTETEENAGAYLKCVIPNSRWEREQDWALTEPSFTGAALPLSDLLLVRNEGSNAVVILISDADAGPALIPPTPFPTLVPSTGTPLLFLADLLVQNSANRTVKITVHSDGETPIQGVFSDVLTVQVCPPIPTRPKVALVPTDGTIVTGTLTEAEETNGLYLKCVIPNAQWEQERHCALYEPRNAGDPLAYSDLFILRNEGPDAVVILISDSDAGPALIPPSPFPALVPSTGNPILFMANLRLLNGTNRTVKISVHSDGEQPIAGGLSDVLTVQVCPPIPGTPKVALVPTDGTAVTGTLTESEEVAGLFLKCVIQNAQWDQEEDWALVEPATAAGVPTAYSDLFLLRNEGPDAVVILISDSDAGPTLIPPRPFPTLIPSTGLPIPFLANLTLASGVNRTVKITVHSDGETPLPGGFSDRLTVQVCPPIPTQPKVAEVPPTGVAVTGTLTEAEETNGLFLKCVIRNAQWDREEDWVLLEPATAAGPPAISDLFFLRNEGPDAAVVLISDADGGPALVPPRPNYTALPSTGQPMTFLANLLLAGGTNRTVKITVHSDGEVLIQGQFSDVLTVQVCPPIPGTPKVADVPVDGTPVSATLTESEEVAGSFIKCVIRNARWDREDDWVLLEPNLAGGPFSISDLFYLRNEGPDAAVILVSDADNGPPLMPPRPNYMTVPSTGLPMPFLANLTLANGSNRTAKITVHSDGETPLPGGLSDRLTVQICPPIPERPKLAEVPVDGTVVSATLTETEELAGAYIKCVIRNARWEREEDWALFEPPVIGVPQAISDLFHLRNEGPDAVIILISDADNGPALLPPRPFPIPLTATGQPLLFLHNLVLANGTNRTVKISVHSDGEIPLPGGFSDRLTVQVCPPIPGDPKITDVSPNGEPVTGTLTEAEEAAGRFLKCVIRNARWEREEDWVLIEPNSPASPPAISDVFYLRNEGPDAAVVLISDSDNGPALIPPRPNPMTILATGQPVLFLGNLLLANGTNRTVKITVHSDGEQPIQGQFSDLLTVQVCPPIPPRPKLCEFFADGSIVTNTLTELEETNGMYIKCFIRNARWEEERDVALVEPPPTTGLSDLFLLRNEGADAVVILISDSDTGPALIPPRPNPTPMLATGNPMGFQANLVLASGTNETAVITVHSDGEVPIQGVFSDVVTVRVCRQIPPITIVRSGGNVSISWIGAGTLQQADALLGDGPPTIWANVAAASPFVTPANRAARFYRVCGCR